MKCCAANQPDCRHLKKSAECWSCTAHGWVTIDPMTDECPWYETESEHLLSVAFQETLEKQRRIYDDFVEDWHLSIIRAVKEGTIIFTVGIIILVLIVWCSL